MLAHHKRTIREWSGSYALLGDEADTAVVFVHGLFGDPYHSWLQFQYLVDRLAADYPEWQTVDLYFYDYQGASNVVERSSIALGEFISAIFPKADDELFAPLRGSVLGLIEPQIGLRELPVTYTNLVLVGHSLGAVILRKLVLLTLQRSLERVSAQGDKVAKQQELLKLNPLLGAKVYLFAPAHRGYKHSGLIDLVTGVCPFSVGIRAICQGYFLKVYDELSKDSTVLQDIRDYTDQFADSYPGLAALKARLLWGDKENVVVRGGYKYDVSVKDAEGKGHTDVCKPEREYVEPLLFVSHGISKTGPAVSSG